MDLYDHLLVLEDARLTVLSRRPQAPGGYEVQVVPLTEVAAVLDTVNLLDGRLHLHTRDGRVLTLAYDGSSRDRVRRLVDGLRTSGDRVPAPRAAARDAPGDDAPGVFGSDALGAADVALVADVREVTAGRPALQVAPGTGAGPSAPRGPARGCAA